VKCIGIVSGTTKWNLCKNFLLVKICKPKFLVIFFANLFYWISYSTGTGIPIRYTVVDPQNWLKWSWTEADQIVAPTQIVNWPQITQMNRYQHWIVNWLTFFLFFPTFGCRSVQCLPVYRNDQTLPVPVTKDSVADPDPGSGAFLPPRIRDPWCFYLGSRIRPIFV
jgi:hypothetical protein